VVRSSQCAAGRVVSARRRAYILLCQVVVTAMHTHTPNACYVCADSSPTDRSTVSTQRFAYYRSVDRWIGPSHSSTSLLFYLPTSLARQDRHTRHAPCTHTHTHIHTSAQSRPTGVRSTQYEGTDEMSGWLSERADEEGGSSSSLLAVSDCTHTRTYVRGERLLRAKIARTCP